MTCYARTIRTSGATIRGYATTIRAFSPMIRFLLRQARYDTAQAPTGTHELGINVVHGCPGCFLNFRAASGARTRDLRLGKPLLYQLSYCRKQKKNQVSKPGSCGADNETRTRDPRITNALLYQLSHIGILLSIRLQNYQNFSDYANKRQKKGISNNVYLLSWT